MTAPTPPAADGEEFTELVDAEFPRVDLVGKAANGTAFLIRKAAADGLTQPLVPADKVRELIAKAEEADTVTDPAPDVAKAAPPVETGDLVEDAPGGSTAESLPGSPDWEQLDGDTAMNAVATLGRVKACLSWLAGREAQEAVTGDADGDGAENSWDLDDMACQIDWMISRLAGFAVGEHMEADMADELETVGKAAAELAAPLAVVEGYGPVVKAGRMLSGANEATLTSAADKIEEASQSIRGILAALPQAPAADETVTKSEETVVAVVPKTVVVNVKAQMVNADGEPIEKGADLAAELLKGARTLTQAEAFRTLVGGGVAVEKAKGDPAMAVFDANGKLVGVIDPADLQPIAETAPPADGDAQGADDTAAAAPADDAAAAAPAADDASRVVPGTDTVQAPPAAPAEDEKTPAVAKTAADETAIAKAAVDVALKEALAPFAEQLGAIPGLAKAFGDLEERVEKMAQQPDDRRSPVLNGGRGIPGAVTRDGSSENPLEDIKKAIAAEPDPAKRMAMSKEAFLAVASRFQG